MILYYSGTGNSEYAARRIGRGTGDEAVNLFDRIRTRDFREVYSELPWVIAAPTYAWRIPRILQEWLEKTSLSGNKDIYFVMTCGSGIGNAGKYLEKLCERKNMNFCGCLPVVMPENYIALFSAPNPEKEAAVRRKAEERIDKIIPFIRHGQKFPQMPITVVDRLSSGVVNDIFYPLFVHADPFFVKDNCISCGLCERVCPLNNVHMENGRPAWGRDCTHCMACISRCPTEAIEYGKSSRGKRRYVCSWEEAGDKTEARKEV